MCFNNSGCNNSCLIWIIIIILLICCCGGNTGCGCGDNTTDCNSCC